jgi:serine/threonine protein kinase, bacterial
MQTWLNNRYRVIQTLGSGGFGETFLAEDTQMPSQRRCVIKLLKPITTSPQIYQLVQERFQREAAILEELGGGSNQIPNLYAYFQQDSQFYLVQEWVEGLTLTEKVRKEGRVSEQIVQDLLISLLPVIEYVHGKRIVHRDIKPDNIIIRYRDEKPVLIDFGAVRESMGTVVNSQGSPTSSIIIGTPGYMPSEQAAGRPVYSSDLYSLGITSIYLLTGKQPQELESDPQTGEIVWRQFATGISHEMMQIIDHALFTTVGIAYHPRERFSSAREMLSALGGVVNTVAPAYQVPVTLVSPPETIPVIPQTTHSPRPNNSIFLGSLIAGGLIGASTIIGLVLTRFSQSPTTNIASDITPTNTTSPKANQSITQNQITPVVTASPNDYVFLSQRLVRDEDLANKTALELDIMRNSIFAKYGRKFDTPGLQDYFNKQSWYQPRYSSQEFDKLNLLSKTEIQNASYIIQYQKNNNLLYFR